MTNENILNYCLTKKGARKDYPFGPEPLVIKIGSKMFAIFNRKNSISLKCDPFLAGNFRKQYKSVSGGYHLNKQHWNTIELDGTVPADLMKEMIDESYDLIVKSLTKKQKEELKNQ